MSQPIVKKYPAEFKERAVKLAVESDQPIAQTARDLGINENTLHTWIGKYHRAERQESQVHGSIPPSSTLNAGDYRQCGEAWVMYQRNAFSNKPLLEGSSSQSLQ